MNKLALWGGQVLCCFFLGACGAGGGQEQAVNEDAVAILAQPAETLVSANSPTFMALKRIVAPIAGVQEDSLSPATTLAKLNLDGGRTNPDFIEVVIQVENEFSVSISEAESGKLGNLNQLCQLIDRLPKKKLGE
jgi:acyl carrier protein